MNTRITQAAKNWAAALAIVAIYAGMQCLDGPSDQATQAAQEADLQAAIKTEAAQARFAGAAAQICGNAGYSQDADGAVVCHVRKPRGAGAVLTKMEAL